MEEKMISILIPAHHAAATLRSAVESALKGSKKCRTEILLMDDGADDDTSALCRDLMREYDTVRVHKMQDRGVSAARNLAMDKASGDYICFLDADDRILPGGLDVLYDILTQTHADAAGGTFVTGVQDTDCPDEEAAPAAGDLQELAGEAFVRDGILQRDTHVWGKLFRKEAAGVCRFSEGMTIGEDMLYLLSLAGEKEDFRIVRTQTPVWFYRLNPKGAMERPYTKSFYDQIRCWERAEKKIRQYFPLLFQKEEVYTQFQRTRLVTAMLVPGKIIRLPAKAQEEFKEDYENARACVQTLYHDPDVRRALEPQERVKALLFLSFPRLYKRVFGV
ncbi:MAG: glycosyltransferase family 2 protein [Lachnospiraceae bacterium]|nr:glycosyltransferase family 2 protein [Lachnospiraceae bacterium]